MQGDVAVAVQQTGQPCYKLRGNNRSLLHAYAPRGLNAGRLEQDIVPWEKRRWAEIGCAKQHATRSIEVPCGVCEDNAWHPTHWRLEKMFLAWLAW
jgi:hypothetical protein